MTPDPNPGPDPGLPDTRRALLDALADGPVAGPALADRLGVSRAAVWKQVEALREAGFGVESVDGGYAVTDVPAYGGEALAFGLDAPFAVEYRDALPSTNDRARDLAAAGAAETAVVAGEQTAGRGRLDRGWDSPAGGAWLSVLLRPDVPPAHAPAYTMATAVAVTRACREAGVDALIKWPNDVLVGGSTADCAGTDVDAEPRDDRDVRADPAGHDDSDDLDGPDDRGGRGGRKLCGILTEMEGEADRVSWLVVGVGLNANVATADLPPGATSLRAELGREVDRRRLVQRVLELVDGLRGDLDEVLPAWREHAATLGRRVRVETPGGVVVGEAVDVEFPGALVVRTDEGEEVRVTAGDCDHLRPA